jgi:hypothetical protein
MIAKDLGKPLAVGRTAELFAWQSNQVIKLFFDWFDLEDIKFAQHMANTVHSCGLPVPASGNILQVNGHNGLIYERVNGLNMWEALKKQPGRVFEFARWTARLHVEMHSNMLQLDIPSQRKRLERKLQERNFYRTLKNRCYSQPWLPCPTGVVSAMVVFILEIFCLAPIVR